jgi:hypothetical protein
MLADHVPNSQGFCSCCGAPWPCSQIRTQPRDTTGPVLRTEAARLGQREQDG